MHPIHTLVSLGEQRHDPTDCAQLGRPHLGPCIHPTSVTGPLSPALTLRCAGLYLIRHGWHQGDMFADPDQPTPAACALGAIRMAVIGSPVVDADLLHPDAVEEFGQAVAAFADHLELSYGVSDLTDVASALDWEAEQVIAGWNDDGTRIASHVIAAMHGAADEWERTHSRADTGPGEPEHADYPHMPGCLYDCPACEATCHCPDDGVQCVHCAITAETADGMATVGGAG
jgi:hypothetical protein